MLAWRFAESIDEHMPTGVSLSFTQSQFGRVVVITAIPTPDDESLWFQWYADGMPDGQLTRERTYGIGLRDEDIAEVTAVAFWTDDIDPFDYAPIATDRSGRFEWFDSLDPLAAEYIIETAADDPPTTWVQAARVRRDGRWRYQYRSQNSAGARVSVRVRSVSAEGDIGSAVTIGPLSIAGRSGAPEVAITYSGGTQRITVT